MSENLTDAGNAKRLARLHGDDLRFVTRQKRWLVWDGTRFREDSTLEVVRRAKTVSMDLTQEAAIEKNDTARANLNKAARSIESERSIKAMINLAKSEHPIAASPGDFDQDAWLLNTAKGMVDLRTGEVRPHDRLAMCSKITGAGYVPGARSDLWERCLATWLADPEIRTFVQRAVGYSLIGEVRDHVVLILWGSGCNGKSVFIETVRKALGEYAIQTPTETILNERSTGIPNDVARLVGARFVSATESEENRRLSEAKIKAMTGGDDISARFMRGEWFTFKPAFTLWLSTNHRPVVRGTDEGIWRRIKLIPFDVRIPDEDRDPELSSKLAEELEGVLAWAIQGALDYVEFGLAPPTAVQAATDEYRSDQDVIGAFLDEACDIIEAARVGKDELFERYAGWCEKTREKPVTKVAFGRKLAERGFQDQRTAKARFWVGIRLHEFGFEEMSAL